MVSLWNSKYVLSEKVSRFEADIENFVRCHELFLLGRDASMT